MPRTTTARGLSQLKLWYSSGFEVGKLSSSCLRHIYIDAFQHFTRQTDQDGPPATCRLIFNPLPQNVNIIFAAEPDSQHVTRSMYYTASAVRSLKMSEGPVAVGKRPLVMSSSGNLPGPLSSSRSREHCDTFQWRCSCTRQA